MSVIMNYYRHMDRSKIQFDFLCFLPCEESYEAEIRKLGGRVFFIPKPGISSFRSGELRLFFSTYGSEYQWLHNHEIYLSFLLQPMAKRYGIPRFIVHSHTTKYSDHRGAAVRNRILCTPIRFLNCGRFACSEDAARFLFGERRWNQGSVHILHNAIRSQKYSYSPESRKRLRQELGLEHTFVIGHIGRFTPQKNHKFLLEVMREISPRHPQVHLLLIGDGPLREETENYGRNAGLNEKLHFLGQRTDVSELLNVMDLFVLPSVFEGIGIALVEAQANGLRGIASDCVPREANVTGRITFLPLDVPAWKNALEQQIVRKDTGRSAAVAEAFRRNHYEIQDEACQLEKFYEDTDTYVNL